MDTALFDDNLENFVCKSPNQEEVEKVNAIIKIMEKQVRYTFLKCT